MRLLLPKTTAREATRFVLAFFLIFFAAKAGQYFFFEWKSSPAVLWPPTGIGLAILWLGGYRYAAPIFLGFFAATISGPAAHLIPAVVTTPAAQVLGQVTGVYLLRRYEFDGKFDRMKEVALVFIIIIVSCMIAPTISTAISWMTGNLTTAAYYSWSRSWAGYVFSCLILFPLIVSWAEKGTPSYERRKLELLAVIVLLCGSVYLLFWTRIAAEYSFIIFGAFFIAHFWVGLRFSTRMLTLSMFATTIISITGLVLSPAPGKALNTQLFNTELFLLLLVPIFYAFSALVKERLHIFEELRTALERLENENRTKNEFIAVLAHELRNPLAPVKTTLELLNLQDLEPDMKKLIGSTQKQVHAMRRLLDDLLDMTRVTQGRFQLKIERANFCVMLNQSLETTKELYKERRHTFISPKDCDESIWIDVDPVRFEQVVVNILNNAAKYTDPEGRIEIWYQVDGDMLELSIRDNGIGIDAENLEDIFEPFWQKKIPSLGSGGVGIGLSLTKRIIEMHGGTIQVKSQGAGTGSTFTISMPLSLSNETTKKSQELKTSEAQESARKLHILIVDDNHIAADALSKLLKIRGYAVEVAYDGTSALEIVNKTNPSVIFLDIELPGMSGYEVAKKLRADGCTATIAALSGYGQDEDKRKAMESGFDHHFTKPVAIATLEKYLATIQP